MHETSGLWKEIFSEADHRKEIKVTINGNEYVEDQIIKISYGGRAFDAPSIGNAAARTLELDVMPLELPFGVIPAMSEIKLFVRLVSADGQRVSEYIQKGVFYADTVAIDSDTGMASVSAFDAMMKMEQLLNKTICAITYNDGFGSIQKFERNIGDDMPTVDTPSRDDLDFLGWLPTPESTVVRDMLYMAQWSNSIISSGWFGDNAQYILRKNGLLEVSGSGTTRDCALWIRKEQGAYRYTNLVNVASLLPLSPSIKKIKIRLGISGLGAYAFAGCGHATEIEIPDSVISISGSAFIACEKLAEIRIPGNVTVIKADTFRFCYGLKKIIFNNSVTSIGEYAFSGCAALKDVIIPESVADIGNGAFSGCVALASVTIPEHFTTIANDVFADCAALESVTIPGSVTAIGNGAFSGCQSLMDVYYNGTLAQRDAILIGNDNAYLTNAEWHCVSAYTVTFDSGGGTGVMENEITLGEYMLPENGFTAPANSKFLLWITDDYEGYEPGETIVLDSDIQLTAVWQTGEISWHILNGELTIGGIDDIGAMENYSLASPPPWYNCRESITDVYVADCITSIGNGAFRDCAALERVLADGFDFTSIGSYAFENCVSLTTFECSRYTPLEVIEDYAFSGCGALSTVYIPATLVSIGDYAFSGCDNINAVYYSGTQEQLREIAGIGNESLTENWRGG